MEPVQRGLALAALTVLSGCAASPESIKPADIPTSQYAYLTCPQLAAFKVTLVTAYQKVAEEENSARALDEVQVLTLGLPLGSMTHENVPYQIWDLKGRIVAVEKLQVQDNCGAQRQAFTN